MANVLTNPLGLSPVVTAMRTCVIAILTLLIIAGNILSITVTHRVTNLADSTKVLMTGLATYAVICDLLIGVVSLLSVIPPALAIWGDRLHFSWLLSRCGCWHDRTLSFV